MRGLFITGTDTEVGKTYLTAQIAQQLIATGERKVGVYKPACSGAEQNASGETIWPDVERLVSSIGERYPRNRVCPQCFLAPLAPPVAAAAEGCAVDRELLFSGVKWWEDEAELLLLEGVGGWYCPLTETEMISDFATELGFPVLIVARLGLGTINHTLLTLEAVRAKGLKVAGVLLNEPIQLTDDASVETNAAQIEKWGQTTVLGVTRYRQGFVPRGQIEPDWYELAQQ